MGTAMKDARLPFFWQRSRGRERSPEADASILRRDGGAVAPRARARGIVRRRVDL